MKIVFFGTPFFAAECLKYLIEKGVDVAAVVTQPDRPKGRSSQRVPSPVKELAGIYGIPVFQPEKASNGEFLEAIGQLEAALFVVVAYGQILSQRLLDIPPLGCINVHASLLPKYRGAAPIQRCLMAGEKETGVAIQKMVRQMDAGDVIGIAKVKVPFEMTFGELEERLIELAKPLLLDVIQRYERGVPEGEPQNETGVSFAPKIELEEGEIDWKKPAGEIHNLIRAFSPRPGAWCWICAGTDKKRLKVLRAKVVEGKGAPGERLKEGVVAAGEGAIELLEVQAEGKKAMSALDWLRGQKNILFYL
ncbi:MAG: methionyl-tRNA formyltransferase [Chlamydiales bacterium]